MNPFVVYLLFRFFAAGLGYAVVVVAVSRLLA